MTGKISTEYKRFIRGNARGFSLVELLVVVLIMGVLVGVVGSLMGGFVANFEMTDDQSIARRRASDVFNILQVPLLNAGLGIPADNFDYYFSFNAGSGAVIKDWSGPIDIRKTASPGSTDINGNILRVTYSINSGIKVHWSPSGGAEALPVTQYSAASSGDTNQIRTGKTITLTRNVSDDAEYVTLGPSANPAGVYGVHSYVTFPGIRMHPIYVYGINGDNITTSGKTPKDFDSSNDILLRNVIRALHDMYYVRAGVAYVDSGSTFVFADITSADMPLSALSLAKNVSRAYRVEGITAIHFEKDTDGRGVTVWLIAEGDNSITGRDIENAESQKFRGNPRWSALTGLWDSEKYYEEFSMRWRTRNVETP